MKVWVHRKVGPQRETYPNRDIYINLYRIHEVRESTKDEGCTIIKSANETGNTTQYTVKGDTDDIVAQIEKQILEDKLQAVPDNVNVTVKQKSAPKAKN